MATSSINIKASSGNATLHNHRVFDVAYAIKGESVNEYLSIASISKTRQEIYADYKEFHGRKLNTKATPIREAAVNLNEHHKMDDLKKLSNVLEQRFGIKTLDISIHRDEGHYDSETKEEKINYHAHLVFSWYNKETHTSIKLDKKDMQEMQTIVAKSLGMERGQENSKSVRLEHREYKRAMQEVAIKTKELKQENTQLKYDFRDMQKRITELQEFTAEQRKELHKLNSETKNTSELESKNSKIQELETKIQNLTAAAAVADKEIKDLQEQKKVLVSTVIEALKPEQLEFVKPLEPLAAYKKSSEFVKENVSEQKTEIKTLSEALQATKPLKAENETLKERLSVLKLDMSILNTSLIESRAEVQTIEKHIEARIPVEYEPKRSLRDRFVGFMKDLKEQIKAQASEILSLKALNQELSKELSATRTELMDIHFAAEKKELFLQKFESELRAEITNIADFKQWRDEVYVFEDKLYTPEQNQIVNAYGRELVQAQSKSTAVTKEDLQRAEELHRAKYGQGNDLQIS